MDTLSDHFKLEENWFICEKSCDGNHFKSTQSDILIVRKMLLFCGVRRVLIIMGGNNWNISSTSSLPHIWSAQIIIGVGVDNGNLSF